MGLSNPTMHSGTGKTLHYFRKKFKGNRYNIDYGFSERISFSALLCLLHLFPLRIIAFSFCYITIATSIDNFVNAAAAAFDENSPLSDYLRLLFENVLKCYDQRIHESHDT